MHQPDVGQFLFQWRRVMPVLCIAASLACLHGCVIVSAVDTVGSVAVQGVGLAADAAIGTARIAGKAVGRVADAALDSPKPTP